MHVFDSDAVDMPLRLLVNRFGGCFCLGSGPVFWVFVVFSAVASLFPLAKRKSGWGICGSSFFVWLWFSVLLLQSICRLQGPFVLVQCIFCLLSCKDRAISATPATLGKKSDSRGRALASGGRVFNERVGEVPGLGVRVTVEVTVEVSGFLDVVDMDAGGPSSVVALSERARIEAAR